LNIYELVGLVLTIGMVVVLIIAATSFRDPRPTSPPPLERSRRTDRPDAEPAIAERID
jgi:hypothetical protein